MDDFKSDLLKKLFIEMNDKNIDYCVLRNYNLLPYDNTSKDVDIIVNQYDIKIIHKIINEITLSIDNAMYMRKRHQYLSCYIIFYYNESIKLDFFYDYSWKMNRLMNAKKLLEHRFFYENGFWALDKTLEAVLAWHKPIIYGGKVNLKYQNLIIEQSTKNDDLFIRYLEDLTDENTSKALLKSISNDELTDSARLTENVRRLAKKKGNKKPYVKLWMSLQHIFIESHLRLTNGKRNFISLHGPDGAGKSTVAENLKPILANTLCIDEEDVIIKHFRPYVVPNISVLFSKDKQKAQKVIQENIHNPHEAAPAGFISSIVRLAYYAFDYSIGFWLKIFPLTSKGKIVIFDRYYMDYYVDSIRSRINVPKFFISLFSLLIVKPYASFALIGDAECYYSRKKELSMQEIEHQVEKYNQLARSKKRIYCINGEGTPNEVATDIVIKYVHNRCRML